MGKSCRPLGSQKESHPSNLYKSCGCWSKYGLVLPVAPNLTLRKLGYGPLTRGCNPENRRLYWIHTGSCQRRLATLPGQTLNQLLALDLQAYRPPERRSAESEFGFGAAAIQQGLKQWARLHSTAPPMGSTPRTSKSQRREVVLVDI